MSDERGPTRDEAIAAAKTHAEWTKAWKMTPDGITDEEWQVYQNSDLRSMNPVFRDKVERAMGWKEADVAEAQEITERVTKLVQNLDREAPALVARLRAALRLLENEHITAQGRRIIEKILDEEEGKAS